jgi:uncharacterized protein (DUF3820 family)
MGPSKKEKRETTLMPIGKWAGHFIDEIPSSYLLWVAENWQEDSEFKRHLVKECDTEWQWREKYNCHIDDE